MSLALPTTPRELTQSSWVLLVFFIGPLVLLPFFYWRVYFSLDAHIWSAKFAVALSAPCFLTLIFRTKKLVAKGLLPQWRANLLSQLKTHIAGALGCFLCLYGWSLTGWATELVISADHIQTVSYKVGELRECSGKCSGCTYQLKPQNWFGISTSKLCANAEIWSLLHVGDDIKVYGYFSENVIYISRIQRG